MLRSGTKPQSQMDSGEGSHLPKASTGLGAASARGAACWPFSTRDADEAALTGQVPIRSSPNAVRTPAPTAGPATCAFSTVDPPPDWPLPSRVPAGSHTPGSKIMGPAAPPCCLSPLSAHLAAVDLK